MKLAIVLFILGGGSILLFGSLRPVIGSKRLGFREDLLIFMVREYPLTLAFGFAAIVGALALLVVEWFTTGRR